MESTLEYYAFISYKREDKNEAKRLQKALEYYRLPNTLRQEHPELPEYVRPVFRDMTDLEVGELSAQIHSALEHSNFLIVVCSPLAATSKWVNDEIEYFISLGKHGNIIPYIIEGIPHSINPDEECYPPALLELSKDRELLGANINEVGKDSATIRVISRMFNIRFDTLYRRYEREQKRKRLIWSIVTTLVVVLSFLISFWFYRANHEINKGREKLLVTQSRYLVNEAQIEYNDGNITKARRMVLYALPEDIAESDRPYVLEAEQMLRRCEMRDGITQDTILCRSVLKHYAKINSILFSQNGEYILTASDDRTARVWNTKTGKLIAVMEHQGRVVSADFSPDGKYVLTASKNLASVYNAISSEIKIGPMVHDSSTVQSAIYSPNGKYIITRSQSKGILASDSDVTHIWDAKTGKPIKCNVTSIDFSADGKYAVTSYGRTIQVWDVASSTPITDPIAHFNPVKSVQFTPNGEHIEVESRKRNAKKYHKIIYDILNDTICVYNAKTGASIVDPVNYTWETTTYRSGHFYITPKLVDNLIEVADDKTGKPIVKILHYNGGEKYSSFSSNGKYLAASSENKVYIWDISTGEQAFTPLEHNDVVKSTCFSPDGKLLITVSNDNKVRLWEFINGLDATYLIYNSDDFKYTVLSPKEDISLRVTHNNDVYLWNLEANTPILNLPHLNVNIDAAVFSPNGEYVLTISSDNIVRLWNVESGKLVNELIQNIAKINSAVFSPDGKLFATASKDGTVCIRDGTTGELIGMPLRHNNSVQEITFSPKTNYLATASTSSVYIWDLKTGSPINSPILNDSYVNFIAFNSDETYLATATINCKIFVWDFVKGKLMLELYGGSDMFTPLSPAIFSPDGKSIVALTRGLIANVWDIPTNKCLEYSLFHDDITFSAFFSNDGKSIVTACSDGSVCVWDSSTGKLKYSPLQHNGLIYANFSPSGKYIITVDTDAVSVWDAHTGKLITDSSAQCGFYTTAFFDQNEKYYYIKSGEITKIWSLPSLQDIIDKYSNVTEEDWSLGKEEKDDYSLE